MKVTTLLIVLGVVQVMAESSYSQKTRISLSLSDVSLEKALDEIEKNSEFYFLFNEKLIDTRREVQVSANNERVDDVLNDLFADTEVKYMVFDRQIVLTNSSMEDVSQDLSSALNRSKSKSRSSRGINTVSGVEDAVQGTVTSSEDASGIPGVTILVKGTGLGTVTDINGKFSIEVPDENSVLVFSSIGFITQEVVVGTQSVIDISLQTDVTSLDEVVVVGYGTVKKTDATGALGSVIAENIQARGTANAIEAVQGQIAGVNISRTSGRANVGYDIVIRGQNSISGGSPLFVVDGLIVEDIDFLNPNDIKQLDVLKDASSTAIYGSRGSNGVVIITTKGAGNAGEKISVSYEGYHGIKTPAHLAPMMSAEQWLNYRMASIQGNSLDPFSGDVFGSTNEEVFVSGEEWDQEIQRRIDAGETYDWYKKFMENGYIMNHYLTLRGTAGKTSFGMTAGYQKEKGFIEKDYMDRYTFSIDVKHRFNEQWELGGQFRTGLRETEVAGAKSILNYYRMPPVALASDPTGWLYEDDGLTVRPARFITGSVNPLLDQKYSNSTDRSLDLLGKLYLSYSPTDWLNVKTDFMPRFNWLRTGTYSGLYSDDAGGSQEETNATARNRHRLNYTWDNIVTAQKSLGQHTIQGTGVFSLYSFEEEDFQYEVFNLPQNTSFYNLGTGVERTRSESLYSMNRLVSYLVRFNYDFAGKYLFTASTRWDGSSKLGEGYKWASFPSVAVGWKINEEQFLSGVESINLLKLRASYGFTGNNNIDAFQSNVNANANYYYDFGGLLANGIGPSGIANNALTWERTSELNLGLDFGFFNGRVSGSIDVYSKESNDLLMSRKLPVPMGWDEMTDNIGSVKNEGIEAALRTINIESNDWTWETSIMFSKNVNSVIETNLGEVDDVVNGLFIGQPVNVHYNYDMIGIWQLDEEDEALSFGSEPGRPKIRDISGPDGVPDGKIDAQYDRTVIGSPVPDWIGSFYTKLRWRNIDLSMSLYTEQGTMKQSRFFNDLIYASRNTVAHNYWTVTNPSNEAPSPAFLEDPYWGRKGAQLQNYRETSFTRIQNITLGFTFPQVVLDKIKLERLRIYGNVTNPFLFTSFKGHDPEFGDMGVNDGPSFMTIQLGLNANF